MPTFDQLSPTGDDIADAASSQVGSLGYKRYGWSNDTPAGVPKDNHFIADALDSAGLGFGDNPSDRPSTADWADPSSTIPGWQPVTDGSVQPGDVLATPNPIARNWYEGGGQQLGVATGNGTSIGVIDNNRIGESDWGFQDGHDPVVWRSTQLADDNSPGNAGGKPDTVSQQVGGANLQQLMGLFDQYGSGPRDGKCRATGTCDIRS